MGRGEGGRAEGGGRRAEGVERACAVGISAYPPWPLGGHPYPSTVEYSTHGTTLTDTPGMTRSWWKCDMYDGLWHWSASPNQVAHLCRSAEPSGCAITTEGSLGLEGDQQQSENAAGVVMSPSSAGQSVCGGISARNAGTCPLHASGVDSRGDAEGGRLRVVGMSDVGWSDSSKPVDSIAAVPFAGLP